MKIKIIFVNFMRNKKLNSLTRENFLLVINFN